MLIFCSVRERYSTARFPDFPDSESAELPLAAATSRVSATKAFQLCSKENIQTHGGNGFTWEYDCHLFYKRSKVLSVLLGSEATWKEKLVTSLEKTNTLVKE